MNSSYIYENPYTLALDEGVPFPVCLFPVGCATNCDIFENPDVLATDEAPAS